MPDMPHHSPPFRRIVSISQHLKSSCCASAAEAQHADMHGCSASAMQEVYAKDGVAYMDVMATSSELEEVKRFLQTRQEENHPGNVRDESSRLRAVHGYDKGFSPTLMNKLAAKAKALLSCDSVYCYQLRVNAKYPATDGSGKWVPHRDFDFWHRMDGMPEPNCVVLHVLVNEHTTSNGPLVLCAGSHQEDVLPLVTEDDSWDAGFREDLKYTVNSELVDTWKNKTTMTAPAGTIVAMNPLTWHFSEPNHSDAPRVLFSVVFNDTQNLPTPVPNPRPEFVVQPPSTVW